MAGEESNPEGAPEGLSPEGTNGVKDFNFVVGGMERTDQRRKLSVSADIGEKLRTVHGSVPQTRKQLRNHPVLPSSELHLRGRHGLGSPPPQEMDDILLQDDFDEEDGKDLGY